MSWVWIKIHTLINGRKSEVRNERKQDKGFEIDEVIYQLRGEDFFGMLSAEGYDDDKEEETKA